VNACELCGGTGFELVASEIREGAGRIVRCTSCGLVVQDLDWAPEQFERYYNEEYQETNSLDLTREQTPREHFEDRAATVGPLAERLRRLLRPDMRVLEVGCGAGELLAAVKDEVAEVVGVELHEGFVAFMNDDLGIEAHAEDVNRIHFGDRRFDLIISIATLDHLPNPAETLATLKGLLAPGGSMYLEVPNTGDALMRYIPEPNRTAYETFFWHRAHVFYFTEETLRALLAKTGMSCEIGYRHQYTLVNFLNWYFTGSPQRTYVEAAIGTGLLAGESPFELGMNGMFAEMEPRFHELLETTGTGDTICCVATADR
jgi:2-polyprenyl-3-methyl-5-hydroxy-6-metoxy-1,4-benzoquinol methylase